MSDMSDMSDDMAAKMAEMEADCEARIEEARVGGIEEGRKLEAADEKVARAEQAIDDESWRYDDPTGQDAEDIGHLHGDLIKARDDRNEAYDPEAEAESRHFRACASYMP
jgi:hypothetical protein